VKEALSSLVVGERVVARCYNGLLAAEFALFDPAEVMVAGASGQGVREQGYLTTARSARERLLGAGITPELAHATFAALRPRHQRALARGASVLQAVDRLGPYEAFEGGVFDANTETYQGVWLDLAALALACPLRNTAVLLQAIHLSQVVLEVDDDVPVRLLTVQATTKLRAGERTWTKVHLETARRLPSVLRAMRVPSRSDKLNRNDVDVREEVLQGLRARSTCAKLKDPRIASLASLVAKTGMTPAPVELAGSSVVQDDRRSSPSIERRIAEGVSAGTDPMLLFEELRGHTELLRGEDHLRAVAHFLSGMADRSPTRPELGILASRAWLAAGEASHARHHAKRIAENPSAEDSVRLLALEILETTETEDASPASVEAPPIVPMPILMAVPHGQFAPAGASLPPRASEPVPLPPESRPALVAPRTGFERDVEPPPEPTAARRVTPAMPIVASPVMIVAGGEDPAAVTHPERRTTTTRIETPAPRRLRTTVKVQTPLPPRHEVTAKIDAPAAPRHVATVRIETPAHGARAGGANGELVVPLRAGAMVAARASPSVVPPLLRSEIVESLPLPEGTVEAMLSPGGKPETPDQARVAMTRLSRTLGRDYRLWYGTTLMTNAIAIEAMQRHLRRRFSDASSDPKLAKKLENELMRHGALLSEILARSLGATWVDLSGDQPGRWAMVLYPDVRVWPIGRVYRFFQKGHHEADLVAFFLELEAAVRQGT
jgi:hypothetical protein